MNYEITRAKVRQNKDSFYQDFEEKNEDLIKVLQTAKRNQILREIDV